MKSGQVDKHANTPAPKSRFFQIQNEDVDILDRLQKFEERQ